MDVTGGCLCGAVRYTAVVEKPELGACHCQMCRRSSGGAALEVTVQPDAMTFESADHIKTYTSSPWAERAFCDTCGSSLYYRITAQGDEHGLYMLAAGTLDDLDDMKLTLQVYIDSKPSGYSFAEKTRNMTAAEVEAMYTGN